MSTAPFEVQVDASSRILHLRLKGRWDVAIAKTFVRAAEGAMEGLATSRQPWFVLADCTDFPPQSEDVQDEMLENMHLAQRLGMTRAANLVNSALSQLQVQRLNQSAAIHASFFVDREAAIRWLVEGPAGRPPGSRRTGAG